MLSLPCFEDISSLLSDLDREEWQCDDELIEHAESCLNAFIQHNFTGPPLETQKEDTLDDFLTVDEERPYALLGLSNLLSRCLKICSKLAEQNPACLRTQWLYLKATFLHQRILENFSGSLYEKLFQQCDKVEELLLARNGQGEDLAKFYLQKGLINHYYHRDKPSHAQSFSGLKWQMTGALGRRTKFQSFDTSQLILEAYSSSNVDSNSNVPGNEPKNLDLNDDLLLDKISLVHNETVSKDLTPLDSSILLAFCLNVKNSNPSDGLTNEEMAPYVTRVLEKSNNWSVYTMALLLRSRLENNKSRTVERSVLQLQALVDQFPLIPDEEKLKNSLSDRLNFFHELLLPSIWELKAELAKSFISIGLVRSALEIFEALQMYDNVVECYSLLGKKSQAIELIEDRLLKVNETFPMERAKLLCYLADLKNEPKLFEESWSVSGGRYAKAMRCLGFFQFRQKDYSACADSLNQALSLNSHFESAWFTLGCSLMHLERWEEAVEAFRRLLSLVNYENGEAWNNLASNLLKLGRMEDAFQALKEGVKVAYDNWKIWDNYLTLSLQIGKFSDCLLALHRMLDLKKKQGHSNSDKVNFDLEFFTFFIGKLMGVDHDEIDENLIRNVENFFKRLSLLTSCDHAIWSCWADFQEHFYLNKKNRMESGESEQSENVLARYFELRKKSYRSLLTSKKFTLLGDDFECVAKAAIKLGNDLIQYRHTSSDEAFFEDEIHQVKLLLRNLDKKAQDSFAHLPEYETYFSEFSRLIETFST